MAPFIRCNTDNQVYNWPEFFPGSASKIRSQIGLSKIHWLLVGCSLSRLNQRLQGDETPSALPGFQHRGGNAWHGIFRCILGRVCLARAR
jgi:hypothetical protein